MRREPSCAFVLVALSFVVAVPSADAQNFAFNLSPGQTVPRAVSQASGSCAAVLLELEEDGGESFELSISCEHDVENPIAAHIHRGAAGETGPIVFPFDDPEDVEGLFDLTLEDVALLLTESLYVNVHSAEFPSGEVRGQIRFQAANNEQALIFPLGGDQVVPPFATDASGRCLAVLEEADGDTEIFLVCHHDVADPIAAHIHQQVAGENGPIVIDLGGGESPIFLDDMGLSPELADAFRAGELYVQVHSADNPPGELRGQIDGCREGRNSLCLQDGRFQVEADWRDFMGNTGQARAVRESLDSGILWFFSPDNAEVLIKVLDACNSTFDSFWVFYGATTNVEFTITVTDTRAGVTRRYENELGEPAPPVLDTSAFETCP